LTRNSFAHFRGNPWFPHTEEVKEEEGLASTEESSRSPAQGCSGGVSAASGSDAVEKKKKKISRSKQHMLLEKEKGGKKSQPHATGKGKQRRELFFGRPSGRPSEK